ncbi:MAG: inositol monophosphatase [Alphaproteobacteria bacterium]|nr:MAG: inositol monophosphatase [Alphaproteobacteria bacterium]
MADYEGALGAMIAAARAAGQGLLEDQKNLAGLQVRRKGPADPVSQADERAEQTLRRHLLAYEPGYGFLGEEGGHSAGRDPDGHLWIVDPLDGTANFLCGTPLFGVNVALARHGEVVAGVIYLPALNEMYSACKGGGAFLNGKPIRVSTRAKLAETQLACGIPFAGKPDHDLYAREMAVLTPQVGGIRRTGAASVDLAFVAAGRWDAYWERCTSAWDMAPGVILASEAGGRFCDPSGAPWRLDAGAVLTSNGHVHDALLACLKAAEERTLAARDL